MDKPVVEKLTRWVGNSGKPLFRQKITFFSGKNQNCKTGIYALSAEDCFKRLQRHPELTIAVSFFEIYSNKVFDLLNKKARLSVLEDKNGSIRVVNLTTEPVTCVDDVIDVLSEGSKCRTSGQTSANSNSSRSHAVFQLVLMKGKKMHGTVSHFIRIQNFNSFLVFADRFGW